MKRKISWFLVLCLAVAAFLAGCAKVSPSPSPSPTQTVMPTVTVPPSPATSPATSPGTSPATTGTPSAGVDREASTALQAEVDKLSEVERSYVVVVGNEALVGVEFTAQYKGGVTDRIMEMVDEKAKAASESITKVVLTDDPAQVDRIQKMASETGDIVQEEFRNLISTLEKPA